MTGLTIEQRIGMRIKAARAAAKMTQEELADRIGLARTSITNLEAGRQGIGVSKLARVAEVLHLDLGDLVGADELPPAPHRVRVCRVYEVNCETCGVLDAPRSRPEAVAVRRAHIAERQKAETR